MRYCPRHKLALIGMASRCADCPLGEALRPRDRLLETFAEALRQLAMSRNLRDGGETIAALARVLPWGLGEAATALQFFVDCFQ